MTKSMDLIMCKLKKKEPISLVEIEDVILLDFDRNDGLRMWKDIL